MGVPTNPTAHRLMHAFALFRRLHWRQSPMAGLTPGEMMVLSCIKRAAPPEGGGLRVSEIGSLLRVAAPTITQQLNDMETRGYIVKQSDPDDRRAVRITLTSQGTETVGAAWAAFSASFTGLVDYLGEDDSTQLAELLTKAFAYFDELSERAAEAGDPARAGEPPPRAARFPVNEHRGRSGK
jgi:DNA-binding MarR family transcriptional regulator